MEEETSSACRYGGVGVKTKIKTNQDVPLFYHFLDDFRLVYPAIIHDDHGIGAWEGVHLVEETINE